MKRSLDNTAAQGLYPAKSVAVHHKKDRGQFSRPSEQDNRSFGHQSQAVPRRGSGYGQQGNLAQRRGLRLLSDGSAQDNTVNAPRSSAPDGGDGDKQVVLHTSTADQHRHPAPALSIRVPPRNGGSMHGQGDSQQSRPSSARPVLHAVRSVQDNEYHPPPNSYMAHSAPPRSDAHDSRGGRGGRNRRGGRGARDQNRGGNNRASSGPFNGPGTYPPHSAPPFVGHFNVNFQNMGYQSHPTTATGPGLAVPVPGWTPSYGNTATPYAAYPQYAPQHAHATPFGQPSVPPFQGGFQRGGPNGAFPFPGNSTYGYPMPPPFFHQNGSGGYR
jgi:hypothetical protein